MFRKNALSIVKRLLSRHAINIKTSTYTKDHAGKNASDLICPICKQALNTHPCGSPCYPIYHCLPPCNPDIRWSKFPLPPPPLPPFSSPPPPNLPTYDQICKASSALRGHTNNCNPITTSLQSEPNTPCGYNISTNYERPTSKDCNQSDCECQTAITSIPNDPVCQHYQNIYSSDCDSPDVTTSKGTPVGEISRNLCELLKINTVPTCECQEVTQSPKATRRPFTRPGLPKDNNMHPNSKDYNVSPPYISSEGSSILIFLRCKADNDVEAYTQELCQLSSSKTPSTPSGDCSTSRKRDDQITPSEQIYSSSPTAEFASKPKSGRLSSQIDLRVSLVTPERKCYFFDICKHLTSTTIPSQEDVQKIMTEKNNRYKSICKSQCHIEPTNKNRIHSKLSLEEYCKKCTTSTTSDSCEHRPQPWISQHFFGLQPKYQSNPTVANTCWYTKEREDFNSQNPLKLEHFKPPFVPELPEPQNTYKDCTCNQYLSRPVSQFSSKPPCPTKITPCPDPLKRCPTINSSNPRYNHLPISKEDFCQSIPRSQNYLQFHNRESKCEPGMVTPPPKNYNSPITNCEGTNMTPNKSKPYRRPVQEMLRPPMNSESQTRFNMQKQIDEAKKSKERQHRDFCCPVERGHNQIPYNPCCPVYHKGNYKTFRMIFIYLGFPLILFQMYRICASGGFSDHHKIMPCCEYEYMRRRTKRFPWGDGNNSLFHNPAVNYLPQDCEANCKRKTECICKQSD